jgi:hypothetical protein
MHYSCETEELEEVEEEASVCGYTFTLWLTVRGRRVRGCGECVRGTLEIEESARRTRATVS